MTRNGKFLTLIATVFALFVLALPVRAQENPPGPNQQVKTGSGEPSLQNDEKGIKAGDVQKQLDTINENLSKLIKGLNKTNTGLASAFSEVSKDMKKLQEDMLEIKEQKKDIDLQLNKALAKIKDLEDTVSKLQVEVTSLKYKVSDIKLYPPASDKAGMDDIKSRLDYMEILLKQIKANSTYNPTYTAQSPPPVTVTVGRLVLANATGEEITFIVNNKGYRVAPFTQRILEA